MPQNYDPITGTFHADPQWRRYEPKKPLPLQGLEDVGMPDLPTSPTSAQPAPLPQFSEGADAGPNTYGAPSGVDAWRNDLRRGPAPSSPYPPMAADKPFPSSQTPDLPDLQMPTAPGSPTKWGPEPFGGSPQIPFHVQGNVQPRSQGQEAATALQNIQMPQAPSAPPKDFFQVGTPKVGPGASTASKPLPAPTPPAQGIGPDESVDPRARLMDTISNAGASAWDQLKKLSLGRIPGHGIQMGGGPPVDMPQAPGSPQANLPQGLPAITPPFGGGGGDDIGRRADAIIGGHGQGEPTGFTAPNAGPVAGLQAAGGGPKVEPVGFSFGPESAKPAPRPSSAEALTTLQGGPGESAWQNQPYAQLSNQLTAARNAPVPEGPWGGASKNSQIQALESGLGQQGKFIDEAAATRESFQDKQRKEALEEEKLRQPFEMEKYKTANVPASQLEQQQFLQGQQQRTMEHQRQMQQEMLDKNPLLQLFQSGQIDPTMLHSFNPKSGATTLNTPQKMPAGLETQATSVAQNLQRAGTQAPWYKGGGATKELSAANQSAIDRLNYIQVDPKLKGYVQQAISQHPQGIATPFEEAFDLSEADPGVAEQLQAIWNHLLASRGQ